MTRRTDRPLSAWVGLPLVWLGSAVLAAAVALIASWLTGTLVGLGVR